MTGSFRIVRAGDSMISVEFDARIDPAVNGRAVSLGTGLCRALPPGVRDVVTGYRTVAVYFDPLRTPLDRLLADVERLALREPEPWASQRRPIEVPVCYGGEHGPDLSAVAEYGRCPAPEVVRRHAEPLYHVYMVGFLPGFAYMGRVDARIAAPRRPTPRVRVPAGSVGLAGEQTGIYPMETPGGWQLIGRTPLEPFDPTRSDPFLFKPGDRVRFVPIPPERYAAWAG